MATPNIDLLREGLRKGGYAATISKVSDRINRSNIDATTRLLLAQEPVYVVLLDRIINTLHITDDQGIYFRLLTEVEPYRRNLYRNLVNECLESNNIRLLSSDELRTLVGRVTELNPSPERADAVILAEYAEQQTEGGLPPLVDSYLRQFREVYYDRARKPVVAAAMVEKLHAVGIHVSFTEVNTPGKLEAKKRELNEELFFAYTQALRNMDGGNDPINTVFGGGEATSWDYTVDYFETTEKQGIVRENILAAGALHYIQTFGDQLGVFHVADSIILRWSQGNLDIPQGTAANKLYRHFKLRDQRTSAEERSMFYKQIFNTGGGRVLDRMVVNTDFPTLWEALLSATLDYSERVQTKDVNPGNVSKQAVYEAITELQYNLSVSCSGMVKAIIPEMYAHLQASFDILSEKAIGDQLGSGVDKSLWKVIEKVQQEDYQRTPNVDALRKVAIEGNRIFVFVANFNPSGMTDEAFDAFADTVQRFVLAMKKVGGTPVAASRPALAAPAPMAKQPADEWDF